MFVDTFTVGFGHFINFVDNTKQITRLILKYIQCVWSISISVYCLMNASLLLVHMAFIYSYHFYMTLLCPLRHTVDLRDMGTMSLTSPQASGAVELSMETHNSKVNLFIVSQLLICH